MTYSNLTLDQVLTIVQIIFYTIGTAVAILTYMSAKRGLLNTVNTEYQKRVMDRLKELSDELASEFNPDSPNYWGKEQSTIEAVNEINKTFIKNKKEILKMGEYPFGIPVTKDADRLERIIQNIKTDPFLPRSIRNTVVKFFEKRMDALMEIHLSVLGDYIDGLVKGKYTKNMNDNCYWVHNRVIDKLRESGYGISQVEEEVDKMRLAIQEYFQSYDPLPRRKNR